MKNTLTVSSHISIPETVTEDALEHFYQKTLDFPGIQVYARINAGVSL